MQDEQPSPQAEPAAVPDKTFSFGAFKFDAEGSLFENGNPVRLGPKPLAVLKCLLERPGKVVSKQHLMDKVWNETSVTEDSLAQALKLLRRALADDPANPVYIQTVHRRGYRFIAPVSMEGEQPGDPAHSEPVVTDAEPEISSAWPRRRPALVSLVVVVVAALVALWAGLSSPEVSPPLVTSFYVEAPDGGAIAAERQYLAISPDGSTLVYLIRFQTGASLYARNLADPVARLLETPGTRGTVNPFFSPDGRQLAFFDAYALKTVSLVDGEIATRCEECMAPLGRFTGAGGTWGEDGTIVFANGNLWRLSAEGRSPDAVPTPDTDGPEVWYLWPHFLPGGEWVLVTVQRTRTMYGAEIAAVNIETGEQRTVLEDGANARFVVSGHLVFARDGDLWAAPFDPRALETTGPAELVEKGVAMTGLTGAAQFAVSDTGTLAYYPGGVLGEQNEVLLYDREGNVRSPFAERLDFRNLRFSPDGTRVALTVGARSDYDIWIYDLERGTHIALRAPGSDEIFPVWSPNSRRIAMSSQRDGISEIIVLRADGSSPARQSDPLIVSGEGLLVPTSWSSDGTIAYQVMSPQGEFDIWVVSVEDREPRPFLNTSINEMFPSFSPDGRWLACSCGPEIRVYSYPGKESSFSVGGPGVGPTWGSNGNELYYFWNGIWMVSFEGLDRVPQPPRKLDIPGGRGGFFDVMPDGRGFGVLERNFTFTTTPEIVVKLNWFEDLKQRVPGGR